MDWGHLHDEAMGLTDRALRHRRRGRIAQAGKLFAQALEQERRALELMGEVDEPIYSTMYRSAATLALDCEQYRLAEKLASTALAGDPPEYLVWELREVVEQANFHTHLRLDGVELSDSELQVSVSGSRVGFGYAMYEDWQPRFEGAVELTQRVWGYLSGRPLSQSAASTKSKGNMVATWLTPLRTGSMAATIKLGMSDEALMSGVTQFDQVVRVTLDVVEAVDNSDPANLASKCPDEMYRRKFVQLVKKIAPDGERVSQVGFTASSWGMERTVPLRRHQSEISVPRPQSPESRPEIITGRLLSADGTSETSKVINIVQADGSRRRIRVPTGMMDDIVRPYWNEMVAVECTVKGKTVTLVGIEGV